MPDFSLAIQGQVSNRGEFVQIRIAAKPFLDFDASPLQFLVLHFEFNLVDFQFVKQPLRLRGHVGGAARGTTCSETLLRPAAQLTGIRHVALAFALRHPSLPLARLILAQRRF